MDVATNKLDALECFGTAWRSFQKAWIPICLISTFIMVFNVLPRILAYPEIQSLKEEGSTVVTVAAEKGLTQVEHNIENLNLRVVSLGMKLLRMLPYILPITTLLTVILLLYSNWAVKDEKNRHWPLGRIVRTAFFHFALALVKAIAFFTCIIPGVFLYVKVYFVPLIMLEENANPINAMRKSWHMTTGNFWQLLFLILINGSIQIIALPSIIGAIPATGYANTVRAAAYRRLLDGLPSPPQLPGERW